MSKVSFLADVNLGYGEKDSAISRGELNPPANSTIGKFDN
jgi:hypothetical protein